MPRLQNARTLSPPRLHPAAAPLARHLVGPIVVLAHGAQPVALLELDGGTVLVVARDPVAVVVVAADRALPIAWLPLLRSQTVGPIY